MPNLKSRIVGIVDIDDGVADSWYETGAGRCLSTRLRVTSDLDGATHECSTSSYFVADPHRLQGELDRLYRELVAR